MGVSSMDTVRILIADYNEAFRENLAELLQSRYTVKTCGDGAVALSLLSDFMPDILVTDLMLPNIDGFYLLEQAGTRPHPAEIYVISGFLAVPVQERLLSLGVYGMLRKPCDLLQAEGNIRALAQRLSNAVQHREMNTVSELLLRLGFQTHMHGYEQLLRAIPMFSRDPRQPLNKVICTAIAKELGLSGQKPVERSIRAAIIQSYRCGDTGLWDHLFPEEALKSRKAPSNKQFVARISEYLQREYSR